MTTGSRKFRARFEMWDQDNVYAEANYGLVRLEDASNGYRLTVDEYTPAGGAIRDAGDAFGADFADGAGVQLSTVDADLTGGHCTERHSGVPGWSVER